MNSRRWQRVEEVFFAVVDRPETERAAAVAELCGDDGELRAEVDRLLAADRTQTAGGFLEAAPQTSADGGPIFDEHPPGQRIGRYLVERTIGEGGMGTVLLAARAEDFEQRAAIKVLHRGLYGERFVRRFHEELRILAALAEHPNIASLYDAGTCDDGRPYFVMEYIAGERIDRYCDERQLTTRERIEVFLQVCGAVQFAHQHTVVHRDLKPSNILVDAQGAPKLIDFGIAKIVGDGMGEGASDGIGGGTGGDAARAVTEQLALTPEYASPEQFRGQRVTTASDVYSLGVVLYELLTGRRPYNFATQTPLEMQRAVCEIEPEAPSTAVLRDTRPVRSAAGEGAADSTVGEPTDSQAIAAARNTPPARLRRQLAGDLDNIVLTALRKEPQRRYATVEQLAEDLRRHLAGLPIRARRDSALYRAKKFVGRNRLAVAAALVLLVALAAGIIGTTRGMFAAREAQQKSQRSLAQAIEAVRRMLSRVGSDRLAHVPHAGPARREILQDALEFCETFAAEHADDPAAQLELGRVSYLLGVIHRELGEHEASRAAFDRAIAVLGELTASGGGESAASVEEAREELALSCYHASTQLRDVGELEAAERLLQRAIDIQERLVRDRPDDLVRLQDLVNSTNNLAVAQIDLDRIDAARATLDRVMGLIPPLEASGDPHAREVAAYGHNNLGFLLRRLKRYRGAERAYEAGRTLRQALADEFPDQPWHRKELALSYNNLGVLHGDMGDREKAAEEFAAAVRLGRQLAADFPSYPVYRQELARSLLNLGVTLRDQGFLDDSDTVLDEAAAMQRELAASYRDVPLYGEELARSLCEIAVNASRHGDRERADAALEEARSVDERNPRVQVLLGRSHAASRRWQAAVDAFTAALAAESDDHETLDRRGGAYRQLNQHEAALADFTRAIELSPDDPTYRRHRGSVLRDLGRLGEAVAEYDRAIELRSDYENAYNSRGLAFVDLGDLDRAIADFSRSLEISPDDPIVLVNRARTYAATERWPEAIDDYSAALAREGDDLDALRELAIAQLSSGDSAGYRETCARLLAAARANDEEAARCVWTIVLGPDGGADFGECVAIARRSLELDADNSTGAVGRRRAILGAALFRNGQSIEAGEQLALALPALSVEAVERRFSPTGVDVLRLAALVANTQARFADAATHAAQATAREAAAEAAARKSKGENVRYWSIAAVSTRLRKELDANVKLPQ